MEYVPYLHWFIVLGIFCGLVALLYTKAVHYVERWAYNTKIPSFIVLVIGGLLTGVVGLISPRLGSVDIDFRIGANVLYFREVANIPSVFGALDYGLILDAFNAGASGEFGFDPFFASMGLTIIIFIVFKAIATALSAGTGNSGGVFGPALVLGAFSGYFVAKILSTAGLDFSPAMFALFTLTGMASVYTGSSKAVLTMIFMASEMTQSYQSFLPLMITCSISYFMSRILMKDTIDSQKLALKGLKINMAGPTDLLATTRVMEIMTKDVVCVPENMKMKDFSSINELLDHFAYPIVDSKGEFLGMITSYNLKQAQLDGQLEMTVLEKGEKNPIVVYPDELVMRALSAIYISEIDRLAVLESPDRKYLVGIVSHSDIMRCLEIQRLRDLEIKSKLEEDTAKIVLNRIEKIAMEQPELYQQVKVISRAGKLKEKTLLEYLREQSTKVERNQPIGKRKEEIIKLSEWIKKNHK
jgi:CIC family chloride channel protein